MTGLQSASAPQRPPAAGLSLPWVALAAWAVLIGLGCPIRASHAASIEDFPAVVELSGHVPPALAALTPIDGNSDAARTSDGDDDGAPLILTIVLERDDRTGFERFLRDVYRPGSAHYRRFLAQEALADRFGPSREAYDVVADYLMTSGFELVQGSGNRLTLTVLGSKRTAERAFGARIHTYRAGDDTFYANDTEPSLPAEIARHVESIIGLSSLAKPQPAVKAIKAGGCAISAAAMSFFPVQGASETRAAWEARVWACYNKVFDDCMNDVQYSNQNAANGGLPPNPWPPTVCSKDPTGTQQTAADATGAYGAARRRAADSAVSSLPWTEIDGSGQTIALLQFDNFHLDDVRDFLELTGAPADQIDKLSAVAVNGGASVGSNEREVLLDITDVMSVAPGADVVVYHAPFSGPGTSFQGLLNAAIDGGATIISNSWAYCENQTTLADVQSIESILQSAAASGISVFSASGDSGSTCLNGSPDTVTVPAGAPSLTAVGGSSLIVGPAQTYGSETWWDGSGDTPRTGQGGFGVSRFFSRPSYQDGETGSVMRSVPDVVANADPARGIFLCQASEGGCPTGLLYGGTSLAAPTWAAFTALLNQAQGENLGLLNPLLYPLADSDAFHDAESMGSDFDHVGLGSPNLSVMHRLLSGTPLGAVSAERSNVSVDSGVVPPLLGVPADGATAAVVVVRLRDENDHTVDGKTVVLEADPADNAVITPVNDVSNVANGAAIFEVTTLVPETTTFTATDVTDGVVIDQTATITFTVPLAASGGITAFPTDIAANGVESTTISVTLQDGLGRPVPGKVVNLSQGPGHSIIDGPEPSVTDANGMIQFTATNRVNETVTYTAVDVTDGDLPVPGSAQVTFSGAGSSCVSTTPPAGENGFVVTPFATGFVAENFFYGGVNWGGCPGASSPAFLGGDVFIASFRTGDFHRLDSDGGAVSSASILATHSPTLSFPTVGRDGRLYALFGAATTSFPSGSVVEFDAQTGEILRTLASGQKCPSGLAVDPLSGDLFFAHQCFGGAAEDASIHRVRDAESTSPTVEVYATLPAATNGVLSFAPDGTLYAAVAYNTAAPYVVRVAGTDTPAPPAQTPIPEIPVIYWLTVGEAGPDGAARSLLALTLDGLELFDLTLDPPVGTVVATNLGSGVIGPDGCLYVGNQDTVFKVGRDDGSCEFSPSSARASLSLTPGVVTPNPLQGSELSFVATLRNATVPAGTQVTFFVEGTNPALGSARTDAGGSATFRYRGAVTGADVVRAFVDYEDAGLFSNRARITWDNGRHVTDLSLDPSPTVGATGQRIEVVASLVDESVEPATAVVGATVEFDLDGSECSAVTDAAGIAACDVIPEDPRLQTLVASFAGTSQLVGASDSTGFNVLCGTCGDPAADGIITARDALVALRTSIGTATCHACLCDVNNSGSILANDALAILRRAVGHPVVLACPLA